MGLENNFGKPAEAGFTQDDTDRKIERFLKASVQGNGAIMIEEGVPGYEGSVVIPVPPPERMEFIEKVKRIEADREAEIAWPQGGLQA